MSEDAVASTPAAHRNVWIGVGVVLLLAVAYIHLALMTRVEGFNRFLAGLFGMDAALAVVAAVALLAGKRFGVWAGVVASGGAAVVRIAMDVSPGFARWVLRPPGPVRGLPLHALPGQLAMHGAAPLSHGLPLLVATPTLATISILIELAFVAVVWVARLNP